MHHINHLNLAMDLVKFVTVMIVIEALHCFVVDLVQHYHREQKKDLAESVAND